VHRCEQEVMEQVAGDLFGHDSLQEIKMVFLINFINF